MRNTVNVRAYEKLYQTGWGLSVCGGTVDVIDDEDVFRAFAGFEPEPELGQGREGG